MYVHFLHTLASRFQILTRIEMVGMLCKVFADSGCHSQTAVAVNVYLAYSALGCLAKLLLGNTYGCLQSTAIGVDGVYLILRHRA